MAVNEPTAPQTDAGQSGQFLLDSYRECIEEIYTVSLHQVNFAGNALHVQLYCVRRHKGLFLTTPGIYATHASSM